MIKISPSLLSADFTKIGEEVKKIHGKAEMLHLDVMDGHFVPNLSFGVPVIKSVRKITDMILDTHLMIEKPSKYIKAFADAGSDIITIHAEAPDDIGECLKYIRSLGKKSGLAINPDTKPETIGKYLDDTDMVLQMTVFPGFGGQGMVESALLNIPVLRKMIGDKDLEVDGGIYADNVYKVVERGANVIVSGTGIFGAPDSAAAADEMRKACGGAVK